MSTNDIDQNLSRVEALSRLPQITARSEKRTRAQGAFPVLLLCVFFAALLGALIAGVTVYRNISDIQEQNVARREGLELISNIVRANDAKGAVATGEGPEGRALVIVETLDTGTFETRLYLYHGHVVQEYSPAGTAYTSQKASEVTASKTFSFSYSHGLLSVTTDQGACEVALRYLEEAE